MLGRVLLHDVGGGDGGGGVGLERQRGRLLFERRDRKAEFLERRSDLAQARADAVLNVWERIRDRHLQPVCKEERSPRDPDDAPADDGRIPELVLSVRVVRHLRSLCDGEQAVQAQSPPHLRQLRVTRLHGVIEPGLHLGYPQIELQTTGLFSLAVSSGIGDAADRVRELRTPRSAAGKRTTRRPRRAAAASRRRAGRAASPSARDTRHARERQRSDQPHLDEAEPAGRERDQGEQLGRRIREPTTAGKGAGRKPAQLLAMVRRRSIRNTER